MLPENTLTPPMAPPIAPPPATPAAPAHTDYGFWNAFEHILLFISLYVFSIAFTLMLHTFVDHWLPSSPNTLNYYVSNLNTSMLRSYMSALIVSYPLFAFFFLQLARRAQEQPAIRSAKNRKSLIYFTLVMTFIISLGNIINTVSSFLNGNVTLNFFLKFFITIVVCATIFAYYLYQVREDRQYHA